MSSAGSCKGGPGSTAGVTARPDRKAAVERGQNNGVKTAGPLNAIGEGSFTLSLGHARHSAQKGTPSAACSCEHVVRQPGGGRIYGPQAKRGAELHPTLSYTTAHV
ncbi:hypothetical protein PAMP_001025 [Pampus punctatissimus]